ncbi:tRNA (adenine-N(1))-methyltransferase [Pseudomonas sp. AFG_SD02_1510_Pfu_092]|uniref:tRNA (adenine(22)-N(1))-methyltransferase n=1 Tax=Pseudomonas sp. AFG_SD02_1510_Pfu_092 TaxID=2259497 RepID=UPI000DEEC73C|nr:tRNA (adenine(22)-N(1))-methyltransferase TrmK [Pseudomonas sp. AFG_SD02_1510_Pfu_092]RCL23285.1 tRNA (adenine-N(1))-methyltransferase [Pseudomonas sp. AFG_SD02_1510_Pfu_092]
MNEQTLSRRLERVAAHVPHGARLADIGSDHGYLPVALMLRGRLEAAVAGEVAQTPFASAQRNVRKNGLEGRVTVRLADGLAAVEAQDRISVVSICGMGGDSMCEILEAGRQRLAGVSRLVLQPNGAERELRQWLAANGYRIVSEELLRENRFDYEIIVAEPGAAVYSAEQLYFGPLLLQEKGEAFLVKWRRMLRQKQQTLANFERARDAVPQAKIDDFNQQVGWITQVLA